VLQEWVESEEGVPLPLQCVMDLLANLYNTGKRPLEGLLAALACISAVATFEAV
jgi:hypothetical protein